MGLQVWSGLHVMVPLPFTWWPFGHVMLTDCPTWNILWETFLLVFSLQTGGGGQGKAARNNKIYFFLIIIILSILTLKTNFRQPQEQSWQFVVMGNKISSVVFAVCVRACVCFSVSVVSHVGRRGKWSSRCFLRYTRPVDLQPGGILYCTGTGQRGPCSGWARALCRFASLWGSGSLWPLEAGSRLHAGEGFWRCRWMLPPEGADLHTFTCRCWEAPCAVGLTEESPGAQQLQPSVTDVRGVLWEWLPLHLDVCTVYRRRRPTGLRCRHSEQALMTLRFVDVQACNR